MARQRDLSEMAPTPRLAETDAAVVDGILAAAYEADGQDDLTSGGQGLSDVEVLQALMSETTETDVAVLLAKLVSDVDPTQP